MNELEKEKLVLETEELERELASKDFVSFADYVFIPNNFSTDYIQNWHTILLCEALEAVERGDILKLLIEMPPRHSKSEHVSRLFPSWFLGRNPRAEIIHGSHTDKFAEGFGKDVRDLICTNRYQNVFPNVHLRKDQSSKTDWQITSGGSYMARGVGGAITGAGADLFIVDDPVKDWKDANSVVKQKDTWDWFRAVVSTRLSPEGRVVLMMTRWNTQDVIGKSIENEGLVEDGGEWVRLRFPAIAEKDEEHRKKGEALWESRFPLPLLHKKKNTLGTQMWSALYQQDPVRAMGATFRKETFQYFAMSDFERVHEPLRKSDFRCGVFVDPAFSTRDESDDVVVMLVGEHKHTKDLYVFDIFADTVPPSVSISYAISMVQKWQSRGFKVGFVSAEDVSLNKDQQKFVEKLEAKIKERRIYADLERFKPVGKKEDRIKFELEPLFSSGKIYFRSEHEDTMIFTKLEKQLLDFPAGDKVDIPDTLAQAVHTFWNKVVSDEVTEEEMHKDFLKYGKV